MIDYLDAPIPYIVGIPRHVWNKVKDDKELTFDSDVVIYDIDNHKFLRCEALPEIRKDIVIRPIKTMLDIIQKAEDV